MRRWHYILAGVLAALAALWSLQVTGATKPEAADKEAGVAPAAPPAAVSAVSSQVFLPVILNPPGPAQTGKVVLLDFAFMPGVLTVPTGTTVQWDNQDSVAHTVTADGGAFDSGNQDPGAAFQFTFTQSGTYAYYCQYHGGPGGLGMSGTIVVR